jgi:hypothetical protein
MPLDACLRRGVEAGELDAERAAEALDLFGSIAEELRGSMNDADARRLAARRTVEALEREAVERARRLRLQQATARRIGQQLAGYRNGAGENDLGYAVWAHIDHDDTAGFSSLTQRHRAILGLAHSRLDRFLAKFRRDLIGRVRAPADLDRVVDELFGRSTGDPAARELATAWSDTAEYLRQRFNRAGGAIAKRADWGLPQQWDASKVRKAGRQAFIETILPRLDRAAMLDYRTGLPLAEDRLRLLVSEAFDTITTEGWAKRQPRQGAGGRSLARTRGEHRFFVFAGPDAWRLAQAEFGSANPFDAMMGHVEGMARDIAQLEILGPNPPAMLAWMDQVAQRAAHLRDARAGGSAEVDRARRWLSYARDSYQLFTGASNAPADGRIARVMQGTRNVLVSAHLGGAFITSMTDLGFQRAALRFNGLPQARALQRLVKLFAPGSMDDQRAAVRMGLVADNWSQMAIGQARYVGEIAGPELTRRLADFVMRASLLSPWTQAGRWAFGMEMMGTLADHAGKTFGELPAPLQRSLDRYGLGAGGMWDALRSTPLYEHRGASFLRPDEIEARGDLAPGRARELATRFLEMVQTETEYAVPNVSLRGRTILRGNARPGTLAGELILSASMYKSFPVTVMALHMRRGYLEARGGKLGYGLSVLISTALLGGLAIQSGEITKGRDPRHGRPEVLGGGAAAGRWARPLRRPCVRRSDALRAVAAPGACRLGCRPGRRPARAHRRQRAAPGARR